jgi:OOP family OmpA-OmpF porin
MRKSILLLPVMFLFTATSAMAEGFYAGAGIGVTQIEDEEQGISFKDSPFGWRLLAGYDFSDNFGVEGSYINSGTAEDVIQGENVEVELSAFTVSIVGLLPVSDSAQLFGKIGFYSGEQEVTVQGFTLDDDEDGAIIGAGIRWDTSEAFAVRGDFEWYDTDLDTLWSIGVGFQYYFGM